MGLAHPNAIALVSACQRVSRGELADAVASVAAELGPFAVREDGERRVFILTSRSLPSLVIALLATWQVGATAELPPVISPQAVNELLRHHPDPSALVVTDCAEDADGIEARERIVCMTQMRTKWLSPRPPWRRFSASDPLVILHTSGTTALPKRVTKTALEVFGELDALCATFAHLPLRQVTTVAVRHYYGLLFALLLPLRRGSLIADWPALLPSEVAQALDFAVSVPAGDDGTSDGDLDAPVLLISTPAHLRTLAAALASDLAGRKLVALSSGAPLEESLHEALGSELPATDIYGSTETGGIAWRSSARSPWVPFPGVRVEMLDETGQATVSSPWCAPFLSSDRIELATDGTFEVRGRLDRMVKVAGGRVDLGILEQVIRAYPAVLDAMIGVDPDPHNHGRLLALVTPASVDVQALRAHLLRTQDPLLVPRRFAAVAELPRSAAGKPSRAGLLAHFAKRDRGDFPVTHLDSHDGTYSFAVEVPLGSIYFSGHFPGAPLLPAIVQLQEIAVPLARRAFPDLGRLSGCARVKFRAPIRPGTTLTVTFKRHTIRLGDISFGFETSGQGVVCEGTLLFGGTA